MNPVFILPGAIRQRSTELADELSGSALLGTGQFCTQPGLVVLQGGDDSEAFIDAVRERFEVAGVGALLGTRGLRGLGESVKVLLEAGACLLTGGEEFEGPGCRYRNTLLRTSGKTFLATPDALQTEAFGNCTLMVVTEDAEEMLAVAERLEGNLTGSVYSDTGGDDDDFYPVIADRLRIRVGRLLNDKMPTGVAVVPSMNHGGPFPATGHPGFTAVGIPASIRRFAMLQCYDNVRPRRLPPELRDENPFDDLWRLVDGQWIRG